MGIALAAAALGSILFTGLRDLQSARDAQAQARYSEAAGFYESAARKLVWRADLWEQAGLAAYQGGDKEGAIRLLESARDKGALSALGWDALGLAYWTRADHASALALWQAGSQVNPSYPSLYDHLAIAYHEKADYASEQEMLTKRLALADDASAHYRLGLLLTLADTDLAGREFTAASSLDPEFDPAALTLHTALNLAALEPDPARRLVVIGRGLGLVEEWGLAAEAFERAVAADARNAQAWAWLGEARQHTGGAGSVELDRALALDPRDTVVRALRGLYWKRLGRYTDALAEYLQAAQVEPQNPAWRVSAGEAYVQTGDLVSALAAYQKATELAPQDAAYWRLLATFCADNSLQVLEIGLPAAQRAASLAPNDPLALDALGWSYMKAGYLYNAEQNLLLAIQAEPGLALAHLHLAMTYLKKGDNASAFNELSLARQLDSNGPTGELASQLLKEYFP
jgi:tetratricopeptide (TPR) repeat protein